MSEIDQNNFSFTWNIENYSLRIYEKSEVTSPQITLATFAGTRWYLKLYPTGVPTAKDSGETTYPSLFLRRCYEDMFDKEIEIGFTLKLVDGNGKTIKEDTDKTTYIFKKGTSMGYMELVSLGKAANDMFDWKEDVLTIHCEMTYNRRKPKCIVHTRLEANHHSFNIDVSASDSSTEIQGHKFSFSETSLYEVKVAVQKDDVKIAIHKVEEKSVLLRYMICKISLLRSDGEKTLSQRSTHLFESSENNIWEFPSFITIKQLEDGDYIKNNIFTVVCEFSSSSGVDSFDHEDADNRMLWCQFGYLIKLGNDLHNILKNQKHSDIKLRTEDMTFPAHKSLLSARSPVFSTMFSQDMVENLEGVVDISDVDAKTLKHFLEFMYSGGITIEDSESAMKLLLVAEKYEVLDLKEKCSFYLEEVISLENVCEILSLAYLVGHKKLRKSAMDFVATHVTDILGSTQWKEYIQNNNKLMNEIFECIAGDFQITRKTENNLM